MRDRDLVRLYWPVDLRPAFDALFDIDDALADVVARATQPALGAIKLAWWRERLEELDQHKAASEPRLRTAASQLLPRGISGADLAGLEEGWAGMLYDPPEMALLTDHGSRLFDLGAQLLKVPFADETIGAAGRLFAEVQARRRGIIDGVARSVGASVTRIRPRARALTALAALAARDLRRGGPPFEPEGTPGRALKLLRHRLTGRI